MIGPEDTPETEENDSFDNDTTHSDDWGDTETEGTENE